MIRLIHFLHHQEGWKSLMAITYVVICIFDFVIVPSWMGLTRAAMALDMDAISSFDIQVQIEMIKAMTQQHDPFTLKNGGLFHLAFGALLTGSAVTKLKNQE